MRTIRRTSRFKRDFRREAKGPWRKTLDADLLNAVQYLVRDHPLPWKYQDHLLTGDWKDYRDCHLRPDLILIYRFTQNCRLRSIIYPTAAQ